MTTLKLFSGQCPQAGQLPSSTAPTQPPAEHSLLDGVSSAASETHFQTDCATTGDWQAQSQSYSWNQKQHFKLPPPHVQPQSQQQLYSKHAGSGFAVYSGNSASLQQTATGYSHSSYTHPEYSNNTYQPSSAQHSHMQDQQHHGFHPGVQRSARKQHSRSAHRQASAQTACRRPALPMQHAKPHDELQCSEVLSPVGYHRASLQNMSSSASINLMDVSSPDLTESVADSPDDNEVLEDIATSPTSPTPGALTAFLALCQSAQVTTALSKLQATHQLPCPTTLSVLPLDVQNCPLSMSRELATAGSLVQEWSKASQLEWTLAGMFALCLRASLDVLDLDCITLLSLLWILGKSCSLLAPVALCLKQLVAYAWCSQQATSIRACASAVWLV